MRTSCAITPSRCWTVASAWVEGETMMDNVGARFSYRVLLAVLFGSALVGCHADTPQALGTLEYDRITLPSPVAERVVAVDVQEGQRVHAGQPLLHLEATRTQSATQAAVAETRRQHAALAELEAGPRQEQILRARAQVAAAQA